MPLETCRRELASAARVAARRPGATLATAATIAIAVGVATALFSVVDALALRPLPGIDREGLVKVYRTKDGALDSFSGFSHASFRDFEERSETLAGLTAFAGQGLALDAGSGAEVVRAQLVSGGFFPLLGTRAARGRLLAPADDRPGSEVAVVTHALWQQQLGGAEDIVGKHVRLNGQPFTVVGVAEPRFLGPFLGFPSDVFVPLRAAAALRPRLDLTSRGDDSLELIGRVRDGLATATVHAELSGIADQLTREHPEALRGAGGVVHAYSGLDTDLEGPVFGFVGVLVVVALLVMLVACVNVAGLLTGRALERRRENAVRQALGAGRGALLRQLAYETLLPFAAGGALGLALAERAALALHAFLPSFPLPLRLELTPDLRVAGFALALTGATALLFGVLPALRASRVDVVEGLRLGSRGVTARHPLRRAFVSAQVALSLALLVTAGLFARVLHEARGLETGFSTARVALASADVRTLDRSEAAGRRFFEGWHAGLLAQPSVEAAALVGAAPLGFGGLSATVSVDGIEAPGPEGWAAGWNAVSPGYFDTLRIPLRAGRDFDASDTPGAARVAIVSRATAERLFPGADPVGRFLKRDGEALRVVGVAENVAGRRPGELRDLFFYVPFSQRYSARMSVVARGRSGAPFEPLRSVARELDPGLPILAVQPLEQHVGSALFPQRLAASLSGGFGVLGLLLAVVGLYAVVASLVAEKRRELAIRLALGARRWDLRRLVLGDGLRMVGAGLLAGGAAAALLARFMSAFLPGIWLLDPAAFLGAAALLLVVAVLAADLPARRAAATDPSDALRAD